MVLTGSQLDLFQTYEIGYHFRFNRLPSTNNFLKRIAGFTNRPVSCVADLQTSGYGQQCRNWTSQLMDITLSLMLPIDLENQSSNCFPVALSQKVALSIANSLSQFTQSFIGVKWPNDLYVDNRKIGGILIEMTPLLDGQRYIIIGVGINLQDPESHPDGGYAWGRYMTQASRSQIIDSVLYALTSLFNRNTSDFSFSSLDIDEWCMRDIFVRGQLVRVVDSNGYQLAYYQGVNLEGEAMLYYVQTPNKLVRLSSGLVSLREHDH